MKPCVRRGEARLRVLTKQDRNHLSLRDRLDISDALNSAYVYLQEGHCRMAAKNLGFAQHVLQHGQVHMVFSRRVRLDA